MKEDERRLLIDVAAGRWARYSARASGMPANRLRYLCEDKWPAKGWYEYGVTYDLGWLTEAGKAKAAELAGA